MSHFYKTFASFTTKKRSKARSVFLLTCRMVLSAAAPVPWRCGETEKIIKGKRLNLDRAEKAAAAAMKDAEPLAQNDYKIPLFHGLIEQQLTPIAQGRLR
jgi:CO/xanthine dehydrogenase FAD-binding subunit